MQKLNKATWLGLPIFMWVFLAILTVVGMYVGVLGTDFGSTLFWLTVVGAVIMGIGNQIPIVKDYLGGGPLLLLLIGSFATWANWIPEKYVDATNTWMATVNFQAFYLTLLIVGAVMAIERKTLLRSLIGYLPCIVGGLIGAAILGIAAGMICFKLSVGDILMTYVMPVMGGGSAAGALPMSAIYEEVTGKDKDVYYGIAMSALMVANILCIFFAVALDVIGKKFPHTTGDGTQLMRSKKEETNGAEDLSSVPCTMQDIGNALMIMVSCWVMAGMLSK